MINKGDLFIVKATNPQHDIVNCLVEVVRTYNKRDIDPECPESVAIIGMVEIIVLSGTDIGKTMRYPRRSFHRIFRRVEGAA